MKRFFAVSQLILLHFAFVRSACPTGWISNGMGKCYLIGTRSGDWPTCVSYCSAAYIASSPLCIENAAENSWLQSNLEGNTWTGYTNFGYSWSDSAHLGWYDPKKTCPSTYTNWLPGEPNGSGLRAVFKQSMGGKWDDVPTATNYPCGCEILEPADPILCPGPAGRWLAGPSKCYAFPSASQTRSECATTCAGYGGMMACVQNNLQNEYLRHGEDDPMYIGYNDIASEGNFVWQAGCSSTYTQWKAGEPNAKSGEDCTTLHPDPAGSWWDTPCNEDKKCVCERNTLTRAPTALPSFTPTAKPSAAPTKTPSAAPSTAPSFVPSAAPTKVPTAAPSFVPTTKPTIVPTAVPTTKPSTKPTFTPSAAPSTSPTAAPSKTPTAGPSAAPTETPTAGPSVSPSADPTTSPTDSPSDVPTDAPTFAPSFTPTVAPSPLPTIPGPSPSPTAAPTAYYVCPSGSPRVGNKCYDVGGVTTYNACLNVCALFQASYGYATTMVCLENVAELTVLNNYLRVLQSSYPYNVYPGGRSWVAAKQGHWDATCPSTYQPPLNWNQPGSPPAQCWYIVPGYVNSVYLTTNCPSEQYRCICETRTDVPRLW